MGGLRMEVPSALPGITPAVGRLALGRVKLRPRVPDPGCGEIRTAAPSFTSASLVKTPRPGEVTLPRPPAGLATARPPV